MLMTSQKTSATRLRVLQVAFATHYGAMDRWLMDVWRGMDKTRFQFDFIVVEGQRHPYEAQIRRLGGRILSVPDPRRRGAFLRRLRRIMGDEGPYDIVHTHAYALNGYVLLQAMRAGIPVRLVHAHDDRRKTQRDKSWRGRAYGWIARRLIKALSTGGLASSMEAAGIAFGPQWWFDPRWQILPYGIDVSAYEGGPQKEGRGRLGLSEKSKVIGLIAPIQIEKNHDFLIRIFAQLARSDSAAVLLLIGEGPLRPELEALIAEKSLTPRVIILPPAEPHASYLRSMDVFAAPSIYEPSGTLLVEAQAVGLPCVVSEAWPIDADIVKGSVMRLPLEEGLDPWVEAIRLVMNAPKPHAGMAQDAIRLSDYSIDNNVGQLASLYERLYAERLGL